MKCFKGGLAIPKSIQFFSRKFNEGLNQRSRDTPEAEHPACQNIKPGLSHRPFFSLSLFTQRLGKTKSLPQYMTGIMTIAFRTIERTDDIEVETGDIPARKYLGKRRRRGGGIDNFSNTPRVIDLPSTVYRYSSRKGTLTWAWQTRFHPER